MLIDQVLKDISKKINSFYFIIDETTFFAEHVTRALQKHFLKKVTPDNYSLFYASQFDIHDVIEQMNTISMFSTKRLLVFKDAHKLTKEQAAPLLLQIEQKIKDHCLVFIASKKPRYKLFQYAKKKNAVLEFKKVYDSKIPMWIQWIVRQKKKTIDQRATLLLAEKVGADLRCIEMEIDKLSLYIGDAKNIAEEDVKALLYSSRAHSIFELTDAIGHKNKKKALTILEKMMDDGESQIFIFAMVLRHLRNLWKAVEWHAVKSDAEVQRQLGIHPMFWEGFRRQRDAQRHTPFEKHWELAKQTDKAFKTTSVNPRTLMARFVAQVV